MNDMSPAASLNASLNLTDFVESRRIGGFHAVVILLCAAALFGDGYDMSVIGYAASSLSRDLHISPGALGPIFGAGLFGYMVGSLLFGPLADRYGRKTIIVAATLIFGAASLATPLANSVAWLYWFRFAAGIGLGGAASNAIALTADYAPRGRRTTFIMLTWFGFTFGAGLGGPIAAWLINLYGWQGAFYFGGIFPIAVAAALALWLPESVRLLATKGPGQQARIGSILNRLAPGEIPAATTYIPGELAPPTAPVRGLFTGGRTPGTLLIWLMFFTNLMCLYFLMNWLPTVITQLGVAADTAILITSLLHFGGFGGALVIAPLTDRFGPFGVLAVSYFAAGLCIAAIGQVGAAVLPLTLATIAAGFCIVGAQGAANSLATGYYPSAARSTGISWALGVGRIGAIVGPVVAGFMLQAHWTIPAMFMGVASIAIISVLAVLVMRVLPGARRMQKA